VEVALSKKGLAGYTSNSQRARIATETWGHANLYCPNCEADALNYLRANTPAADFDCSCGARFQLKARGRPFGTTISDAAYDKMREAILGDRAPNLYAMHYDRDRWTVRNLILIPSFALSLTAIIKRPPLSPSADRHGWVGCNIALTNIPPDARIAVIVEGNPSSSISVRAQYARMRPLAKLDVKERGWTLDILNAVRSLNKKEFTLTEVYNFESALSRLHPGNHHVSQKIRQQLQELRDLNILEFLGRGKYRLR
jgi:type II restriction enzyme